MQSDASESPPREVLTLSAAQGFLTFNDDIQATAAVTLGALFGGQRQKGVPKMADQTMLFYGAGQANIGAAQLLIMALIQEGLAEEEARSRIWLMDSQVCTCAAEYLTRRLLTGYAAQEAHTSATS